MINNIPKVLHLYWDGSEMPLLCFLTVFTFTKLNPDWAIKIYSPVLRYKIKTWKTDEQKIEYKGKDYFPHLKDLKNCSFITFDFEKIGISNQTSEIQKSDFIRWHLLSTEGGVWSDFDIIYFRGINEINFNNQYLIDRNKEIDFSVCYDFNNPSSHKYSIGFLMAAKECDFYKKIFKKAIENFDKTDYQGAGSQILNKEYPTFRKIFENKKESNIWNMSMDLFYSYDSTKINNIYSTSDINLFTQNSIGLHFYYGSPITKNFIEKFEKVKFNKKIVLLKTIEKFKQNIDSN